MSLFTREELKDVPLDRLKELAKYMRDIGYNVSIITDGSANRRGVWINAIVGADYDHSLSPFVPAGGIAVKEPRKSVRVQRILDKKAKKGK